METELKAKLENAWCVYNVAKSELDAAYQHYERLADLADSKFREIELLSAQLDKLYKETK